MGFEVISPLPDRMHQGLLATYRVRPFLGVPVVWVSEITVVQEPHRFVDEQRRGPYRMWRHEHRFREIAGGVAIEDDVDYELSFGLLGDLVNVVGVRRQLHRIFAYRRATLARMFGSLH
jgi:ligand-binding SRPBCC domain-containing protein